MTGTFVNNGDGTTTVNFGYTASTQKVLDTAGDVAHLLFDQGFFVQPDPENPLTYEELTNQQKLDMIDVLVRRTLINAARQYYVEESIDTARETALADVDTRYL